MNHLGRRRHGRLAVATACLAIIGATPAAAVAEPGYTTILDGTPTGTEASFDKWLQGGPGAFVLQPDGSVLATGGLGMLWYPKLYGDVSYKVDYKDGRATPGYSNGGVMVRFPDPRTPLADRPTSWTYDWLGASGPFPPAQQYVSDPAHPRAGYRSACNNLGRARTDEAWVGVYCGQEIQVNDSPEAAGLDPKKTGSIYNFADLDSAQSNAAERYPTLGVWHTIEIRLVGQQYTILVDDKVINQWDGAIPQDAARNADPPSMARQFLTGYLGVQNHSSASALYYRDARVKELASPPNSITAPAVTGDGFTGRPLSCSPGTWSNVAADQTYVIEWMRSNPGPNAAPTQAQLATAKVGTGGVYTPVAADFGKVVWCRVTVTNAEGGTAWATRAAPPITVATDVSSPVGATVPATLSLAIGAAASFGAFTPGIDKDYTAATTATVVSTAGDARLSVADPSTNATGRLVNGTFSLSSPLRARARNGANTTTVFGDVGSSASPLTLLTYTGPSSNDAVSLDFTQHINATDPLRTGTYTKALTFTLSTTTP